MTRVMERAPHNQDSGSVVYLIEEQSNPSTDYFVQPALSVLGMPVVRCGFADMPPVEDMDEATVVLVRYVPAAWARRIEAVRARLRHLVFFMDDDVLDVAASAGMPLRYRFKLARLAAWRQGWLRQQQAELWVSTPYLQQKYVDWGAKLVLPAPIAEISEFLRVFYHGSASHEAELRWLRSVAEEALRRDERLCFELVGGRDVCRLYRGLPRVTVVHPMKWPAYQAFLAMPGRHIGLAPLLDLPFNRARSYTKFFDITRAGAVGVYSPDSANATVVSHGEDGLVVELEQEAWVEAILNLAQNEPLRSSMLHNALEKQTTLLGMARDSYAGLFEQD